MPSKADRKRPIPSQNGDRRSQQTVADSQLMLDLFNG